MKLYILDKKLHSFLLPSQVEGSFVMPDVDGESLITIEAYQNMWVMFRTDETLIIDKQQYVDNMAILPYNFYMVEKNGVKKLLYATNSYDATMGKYEINLLSDLELKVGSDSYNDIVYTHNYFGANAFSLFYKNYEWYVRKNDNTYVYINDELMTSQLVKVNNGDVLFSYGLIIIFVGKMLIINNPNNIVTIKPTFMQKIAENVVEDKKYDDPIEKNQYADNDYFMKSPRIKRFVNEQEVVLTAPPNPEKQEDKPALVILGPVLATAATSLISFTNQFTKVLNGETTWAKSWPQVLTALIMITTSAVWPNLNKRYDKKVKVENEKKRQDSYMKYLAKKEKIIDQIVFDQKVILQENLLTYQECKKIIMNKDRNLWERKLDQKDFLCTRIGTGSVPTAIKFTYELEDFSLHEDNLKEKLEQLVASHKKIDNVPIQYSFLDNRFTAVIGNSDKVNAFMDETLIQMLSYHSYDELKIVILTDEPHSKRWTKYKTIPHLFGNDKDVRFFASTREERNYLCNYLSQIYESRTKDKDGKETKDDYKCFDCYYLIITDIIQEVRKNDFIKEIFNSDINRGFSIIINENSLSKLPNKCTNFISLGVQTSNVFKNDADNNEQFDFIDEIDLNFNIDGCPEVLSNVPILFEHESKYLPTSLSFLEMFHVGKVEQLNSLYRWQSNNVIKSLKAQVGVDDTGEAIYLDLHEKAHGPHGLIAGTTGSGKSEFIITYILSLALNYSPNEVAFILIDYKGGGLVGAFENASMGIKLPHLAGKITNLDKAEMKRTLVSINSELRRRQSEFNKAREKLGESTIDIYKYQKFFREGKLTDPIPHMFLISDEFAELKAQQPEFMDELISAARIGRSLGVHLILATQKPSGVVNDQIWSNTKFRVCLKVADQSDSNEMIKCPDASTIKNAGRFYLQVGNNEIFVLGQSGWAGANYCPSNTVKKNYDRSVNIINNTGAVIASTEKLVEKKTVDMGDELSNILKYIISVAEKSNTFAKKMWLDSIPAKIYVDDLVKKYNFNYSNLEIEAIVGELDDPKEQRQALLTIPITAGGNSIVYSITGSDKDRFLNSVIYSCANYHSVDDINFYIVDFGAETLRVFSKFPHVGDVVFNGEKEKLNNLFKMIGDEINFRKKEFTNYSGLYTTYCQNSGKKLPYIVVIINEFDGLFECDPTYQELIIQYTRDCERYGISFIVTCTGFTSVRGKLRQQLKNEYVLEMNENDDYTTIVGNWKDVCLFKLPGRGLVKTDKIYEFQTSSIFDDEKFTELMNQKIVELNQKYLKKARRIPVLPDIVDLSLIKDSFTGLDSVPFGISKETMDIVTVDLTQNAAFTVISDDVKNTLDFIKVFSLELKQMFSKLIYIDGTGTLKPLDDSLYISDNFNENLIKLNSELDANCNCMFVMIEIAKIKEKCEGTTFEDFVRKVKSTDKNKMLFVSSSGRVREYDLQPWYVTLVNKQTGIWVGDGFAAQSVFRVTTSLKDSRAQLDNTFAWYVKGGKASIIKIVTKEEPNE